MEKIKSDILKKILSDNRSRLNSAYAFARHKNIHLDESVFSGYIVKIIEPAVESLKDSSEEALENMTLSLYNRILELLSKNILGSGRYPGIDKVLLDILGSFYRLLLTGADTFFPAVVNSIIKLYSLSPDKAAMWKNKITSAAGSITDIETFRELGLAAAWICGMAVYRERGLEILGNTDTGTVKRLLQLEENLKSEEVQGILHQMNENPWTDPHTSGKKSVVIRTAGGFTGFGGEFIRPPGVFLDDGEIIVSDDERGFTLHADRFGEMLVPIGIPFERKDSKSKSAESIIGGNIVTDGMKIPLPDKFRIPVKSQVLSGKTLCFTSSVSCRVFIAGITS